MVLLGRFLTPARIATVGEQAQTALTIPVTRRPGDSPPQFVPPGALRVGDVSLMVHDQVTEVYRVLNDVSGQPLLALRVAAPRLISARGREVVRYATGFLGLAAVATVLLLIVTLNLSVLRPLARITRRAVEIGQGVELAAPLDLRRGDELGQLAAEIDRMVEKLAAARRQLVDQSYLAGVAERARVMLNDLAAAIDQVSAQVANLQHVLRTAPATEILVALDGLDGAATDTIRVASLERYVHTAGRDLAAAVSAARMEADRIAEQSRAIRTLLGDAILRP